METFQSRNMIYCPKCQTKLNHRGKVGVCPKCNFEYYLNPAPCTVSLFTKNNQVLLGKRAFQPRKDTWDLPGGFIEVGETAEAGVLREAKEETGLTAKIVAYLGSSSDVYGDTLVPTLIFGYVLEPVSGEMSARDDVSELMWFDLNATPAELAFPSIQIFLQLLRDYLASNK